MRKELKTKTHGAQSCMYVLQWKNKSVITWFEWILLVLRVETCQKIFFVGTRQSSILVYKFGWFLFRARATLHVQLLEVDLLLIDKLSAECCSEDRSVYGNNHESYMIPNLLRQIGLFFDTIFRATQEKVSNIDPTRN